MSTAREQCQLVLDAEFKKWSAKSWHHILSDLPDPPLDYEVQFEGKTYQVEVELLENTQEYVQILLACDDGTVSTYRRSPMTTIVCRKDGSVPGA